MNIIIFLILLLLLVILILVNLKENFVLRQVSGRNKDINVNQHILRYINYSKVDNIGLEMSYSEFNKIINNIPKNNYYSSIKELNIDLLKHINLESSKINKYGNKSFQINKMINIKKTNKLITYNLEIFRDIKYHYFVIQMQVSNNNNLHSIKSINIIAILLNENLDILSQKKINFDDYFSTKLLTNPDIIKNKILSELNYRSDSKNRCFNKNSTTKLTCLSNNNNTKVGIWDKPCVSNNDCPFYKKNKNYINTRGGCINGYCEMPININKRTYKTYTEDPICYNCKTNNYCKGINCNMCCDDQKDRNKYPNLKSPDYIFSKDTIIRKNLDIKSNIL